VSTPSIAFSASLLQEIRLPSDLELPGVGRAEAEEFITPLRRLLLEEVDVLLRVRSGAGGGAGTMPLLRLLEDMFYDYVVSCCEINAPKAKAVDVFRSSNHV